MANDNPSTEHRLVKRIAIERDGGSLVRELCGANTGLPLATYTTDLRSDIGASLNETVADSSAFRGNDEDRPLPNECS
jgi:hypothetical protein